MSSRLSGVVSAAFLTTLIISGPSQAVSFVNSNFTMLDADGVTFGGTNDIVAEWDGTLNSLNTDANFNMTMASKSSYPFFGFPWVAHHIRVFGPGSYSFDSTCSVAQLESGIAGCGGAPNELLSLTVGPDQLGGHLLYDWNVFTNLDVVLLWDQNGIFTSAPGGDLYLGPAGPIPFPTDVYDLVSRDVDGDGFAGAKTVDEPFIGFSANFNLSAVPLPPALYLFGAGLLGLIGIARKKAA